MKEDCTRSRFAYGDPEPIASLAATETSFSEYGVAISNTYAMTTQSYNDGGHVFLFELYEVDPPTARELNVVNPPSAVPTGQLSIRTFGCAFRPTNKTAYTAADEPADLTSGKPTSAPTGQPSVQPTSMPSDQPSSKPTTQPSSQPTAVPSSA